MTQRRHTDPCPPPRVAYTPGGTGYPITGHALGSPVSPASLDSVATTAAPANRRTTTHPPSVGTIVERPSERTPCPPGAGDLRELQDWRGWTGPVAGAEFVDLFSDRFAPAVIAVGETWFRFLTYRVPRGKVAILRRWAATFAPEKPLGPPYRFGVMIDSRVICNVPGCTVQPFPRAAITDADAIPAADLTPVFGVAGGGEEVSVAIQAGVPYPETPVARMHLEVYPRDLWPDATLNPC